MTFKCNHKNVICPVLENMLEIKYIVQELCSNVSNPTIRKPREYFNIIFARLEIIRLFIFRYLFSDLVHIDTNN